MVPILVPKTRTGRFATTFGRASMPRTFFLLKCCQTRNVATVHWPPCFVTWLGPKSPGFPAVSGGFCKQKHNESIYQKKVIHPGEYFWAGSWGNSLTVRCQTTFFVPWELLGTVPCWFPSIFWNMFSTLVSVCGAFIKNYSSNTSVFFPEPQKITAISRLKLQTLQYEPHVFQRYDSPKSPAFQLFVLPGKGMQGMVFRQIQPIYGWQLLQGYHP